MFLSLTVYLTIAMIPVEMAQGSKAQDCSNQVDSVHLDMDLHSDCLGRACLGQVGWKYVDQVVALSDLGLALPL